jgi:hypothetical protein
MREMILILSVMGWVWTALVGIFLLLRIGFVTKEEKDLKNDPG